MRRKTTRVPTSVRRRGVAREFEEEYAKNFSDNMGAPALSFRMALGSLIIKENNRITDRETVEQIKENPYLQYFLDRISWENFNESGDLKAQVEKFKETYGCYPESVHVDQIYRNKENRAWCKKRGIRISGPPLGSFRVC